MSNFFTLPNGTVIHRPDFTTMDAPQPGEQYASTDYEDCYVSDFASWAASCSRMGIVAPPGWPLRHRHNRAHANKLARHAKRPNGRPRHR